MKNNLGDPERLAHILEAIENIEMFLQNMDFAEFEISKLHLSATERQLEIIGEATASISSDTKLKFPEIEWQPIKRFRNIIAHEYFGVSTQILWGVVRKELPTLKLQIQNAIDHLNR
ncbi:HepT-like ribonuclease domain-containing protein [Dyadobacter frigoris]|uniref:DUF86 domain-containing protein n=1 Tax=Dyadobacter frigoris TaxID=2576211 RepID=A0A4U6D563_9BACT|nr:DUF86 domain-containing protein [Dyadobacter frigoris]TKT91331.1 DUF86 domain-containing protein [Dyadobacter frigoris]GLU56339.1 DUF86 domain-containing protein [Dyadobacter frigoris]